MGLVLKDGEIASSNEKTYSLVGQEVVIMTNAVIARAKSTSSTGPFRKAATT